MRSRINVSGIVWGFFCQGVFGRAVHLFPSSGFLQAAQLLVRIGLSADQEGQGIAAWKLMHRQGRRPLAATVVSFQATTPLGGRRQQIHCVLANCAAATVQISQSGTTRTWLLVRDCRRNSGRAMGTTTSIATWRRGNNAQHRVKNYAPSATSSIEGSRPHPRTGAPARGYGATDQRSENETRCGARC
jgi:hypothetical protein